MIRFWLIFGTILVLAEFILPGLVSVFVGLGALTVAALLFYHQIDMLSTQLSTWFISSMVYIFTLRLLIVQYYPSDQWKAHIDEDQAMIGEVVEVTETIAVGGTGRILHGESEWPAISISNNEIAVGRKARVTGRDNISWVVESMQDHVEES